jgi:hypothetical protein
MCKFHIPTDINCKRLLARIKVGRSGPKDHDGRIGLLRNWIVADNRTNNDQHDQQLEQQYDGTCTWILKNTQFQRWLNENDSLRSIWLTGDSGSGKSILCSFAVKHLLTLRTKPSVAFIFLKFDTHLSRLDMLRMITSGLLDHAVEHGDVPDSAFEALQTSNSEDASLEKLVQGFIDAESERGAVYIFVDGLNEIGDTGPMDVRENRKTSEKELRDTRRLVEFLLKLSINSKSLRLWFSSQRNETTIEWMANVHELEIPSKQAARDVQMYLTAKIKSKISPSIQDPMAELVTKMSLRINADCNFRWAAMMVDSIAQCENDEQALKIARRSVPFSLSELYEDSLERLRNKDVEDQLSHECIGLSR